MKKLILLIGFLAAMSAVPMTAIGSVQTELAQSYALFKKGAYPQALESLSKVQATDNAGKGLVEYWKGLCHSKMQRYDQAIAAYQRAASLGATANDLYYEMGQALYASKKYDPALQAFQRTSSSGYKKDAATFYQGYIHQLQKKYPEALKTYGRLENLEEDPDQVGPPALLQIAEIKYIQAGTVQKKSERNEQIRTDVLPAFRRVMDVASASAAASSARARFMEIAKEIGDDSPKMKNGTALPTKTWHARALQDVKYDSNVVTEANEAVTKVSKKASALTKTEIGAKYEAVIDRTAVIAPEFTASYTRHTDQVTADVFQNDSWSVTPVVRNRVEYLISNKAAATNFDFEFNHTARDYTETHSLKYYSRYYNFVLGQRMSLIGAGNTTISANFKINGSYDPDQNATDPGVTLNQNIRFWGDNFLNLIASADFVRAKDPDWDRRNYRFTGMIYWPKLIFGSDVSTSLDVTFIDTVNLRSTRGVEKTINPSLFLTRNFGKSLHLNLYYAYTRNISLDKATYDYSKHVTGLGIGYRL